MIKLFIKILYKIRLLKYFNLTTRIKVNRGSYKIPVINELGLDNITLSELWMSSILEKIIAIKDGTFIDIGVNTGQTLLKVKSLKPDIKYIGFEPNPNCVFYAQQLISINKIENTTLYPVGVAEVTKLVELNFFTNESTDASATIIADFRPGSKIYRKEIIPCFEFKDINQDNFGTISCIKIDVEGAELEVIQGIKEIIVKDKPFVLIEILPVYEILNKDRMERQTALEEILNSIDYKLFRIHKKNDTEVSLLELIEAIGVHSNIEWCDYILCHESMLSTLSVIKF